MKEWYSLLTNKIESLRNEIKSIDYSSSHYNLKMTKTDKKRIADCKSKIHVINELIMTLGVINPKKNDI